MIDNAATLMKNGASMAIERISGVNDNMSASHYHEYYELYYLESGQRYHLIDDNLYQIDAGQFLLFEPYVLHHSYGDTNVPFCRLLLYFREEEILSTHLKEALAGSSGAYQLTEKESRKFHQFMNKINLEKLHPDHYSQEACKLLLNAMLITLFRNNHQKLKQAQKNQITDIIAYINANYMHDLSINEIAKYFYISPFYMCREFKQYTNATIVQYINKTRISNAQQLLCTTNNSITDISSQIGFSSITHFGRVFKEITGMTPSNWRKHAQVFE